MALSAGWSHTMAVTNDGNGWAWGGNAYGRLGDGTTDSKAMPINTYSSVMQP
jgi:alpha-tubulin suppressor-like RCC1 family protein